MREIRERYLREVIAGDLPERMVFVGGPRQVGKTTFALSFLKNPSVDHPAYMNWDDVRARADILDGKLPPEEKLIILDEIHKFARWRNLVKGFYDTGKHKRKFLITGSARLDHYSRGGDSLQGRYYYYRLHPFTLAETGEDTEALLRFGGFPEPLLRGEERFWRRWQRNRSQRVIYDDIRDLENVREIGLLELLSRELPSRVGAPLSVKKLSEALQVSHETTARWLDIFERIYYCFRISPYGNRRIRAVKKEQKLYLWDWSLVTDPGCRFENMVACHLLKYCHFIEDTEGYDMDIRFLRDTDKREVDFVVLRQNRPLFSVECKSGEKSVNPAIFYFKERTPIDRFYQVHLGKKDYERNGVRVIPFHRFSGEVGLK